MDAVREDGCGVRGPVRRPRTGAANKGGCGMMMGGGEDRRLGPDGRWQ